MSEKPASKVRALQLLGRWSNLGQSHVVFGAGCSCGITLPGMRITDFESDLLDYLASKHSGLRAESIDALLRAIAADKVPKEAVLDALDALARALDSFDELHGGGARQKP